MRIVVILATEQHIATDGDAAGGMNHLQGQRPDQCHQQVDINRPDNSVGVDNVVAKQQLQVDENEHQRIGDGDDIFQYKEGIGVLAETDQAQRQVNAEENGGEGDQSYVACGKYPRKEHAQQQYVEQQNAVITELHDHRQYKYGGNQHDQQGDEAGIRQPVRLEIPDQISHGESTLGLAKRLGGSGDK